MNLIPRLDLCGQFLDRVRERDCKKMVVNKININNMPAEPSIKRMFINRKMASDYTSSDLANGNDSFVNTTMMNLRNNSRSAVTSASHQTTNSQTISTSSSSSSLKAKTTSNQSSTSQRTQQHQKISSVSTSESKSALNLNSSSSISSICSSASDKKVSNVKSGLNELQNNMNEMKSIGNIQGRFNKPIEELDLMDDDMNDGHQEQPLVEFPDDTPLHSVVSSPTELKDLKDMKIEHNMVKNFKARKVVNNDYYEEKARSNFVDQKMIQSGDMSYTESNAADASIARLRKDGIFAEKSKVNASEQKSLVTGEMSQQESSTIAHKNLKLTDGKVSMESSAMQAQKKSQVITSSERIINEQHHSQSSFTSISKSKQIQTNTNQFQITNGMSRSEEELYNMKLDDLKNLSNISTPQEVEQAIKKYSSYINKSITYLRGNQTDNASKLLLKIYDVMQVAWAVQTHGHELGYSLCNELRECGGLDYLMDNCRLEGDIELKFSSAKLLEQCLTTENRAHVVQNGLDKVVYVACACTNTNHANTVERSRIGTGILEHLFKHSEETCSAVVQLGGLDAILFECRKSDVETLRHCATALANLSLYGGAENQEAMINRKVPMWLFPLAFHTDDNIKYYACLAITVLVANAEFESQVLQSGTLGLVEPFVTSHNPPEFAKSNLAHAHGQSKTWLQNLVPILNSKREEARNLAAFHFCMEAGIKKQQGNTNIFNEIGAVEILKKVASCPNAVASKYAAQALRLIGEKLPHKLSQQVPLWSVEDVVEWVKQIGFEDSVSRFENSKVDGDLLLQLTEQNLKDDIEMTNGIARTRFFRELQKLKRMADYSSRDTSNINNYLQGLGPEYSAYTYGMLNAGVDNESLITLSEDQLLNECGIANSIHRFRIMESIRNMENRSTMNEGNLDKSLDVFISYRRSNGSQLASLLKVHLELRGFSVFIDVERLEAGKFDNNLLQSIQKAKHFILVLTNQALDRCIGDAEKKDWVHREIVAALNAECNIIPITDNFAWPTPDKLPEDMRQVSYFNGVMWIHDYQDACVDKLERFLRGECSSRPDIGYSRSLAPSTPSTAGLGRVQPPSYQRMHSNDSGSGKGSDKDVNGNSGSGGGGGGGTTPRGD